MNASDDRNKSNSALSSCRLDVRFAKSGHDWAIYEYTPELDAARRSRARSAGQRPLHRLHAAGIAAAGDDAEVAAGLPERLLIDVDLGGSILGSRSMIYIKFSRRG